MMKFLVTGATGFIGARVVADLQRRHIPIVAAGTEYLQFSPSEELHEVSAHLVAKARQMQAAPSA